MLSDSRSIRFPFSAVKPVARIFICQRWIIRRKEIKIIAIVEKFIKVKDCVALNAEPTWAIWVLHSFLGFEI